MTATQSHDPATEIFSTRVYKAPKDLLFRMWSNPEHISNWWGPRGFTTTTHAMEFKTDGIWRFTMHGPDGTDYASYIKYTLVSKSRIEYKHFTGNGTDFTVRVAFRDVEGGTEMSFRMTFPSPEIRQHLVEKFGAEEGLISTMTRLGEYSASQDPKALELAIVRQLAAPQERVWKALTEPEQLKHWLGPVGVKLHLRSGDFNVGGHWSLVMTGDGWQQEADGEYLSIEPIHFLKMTHRWKKDDVSYKPTTTITYTLHTYEGKTTMTFVQSGFWSEEARMAHLFGWDSCIHQLAILLDATKADRTLLLVREFDAPIDLVWKCWTEPEHLAKWFAPKPYTCPKCEIDLRPGGSIFLVMRSPDGEDHAMSSIIADVEPQKSLGWVFSAEDNEGAAAIEGGTMVTFDDLGGRTKVTVQTYAAAYTDQGVFMVGGMEQGWNVTLDQMVESALERVSKSSNTKVSV